jgi:thioredoxin 1
MIKKTMKYSLIVVTFLCLTLSCAVKKQATKGTTYETVDAKTGNLMLVNFLTSPSLDPILEQAKQANKLVFIDFYATWCTPCKVMDKEVFTTKTTADFLNKNFICYKVDGEKGNGEILKTLYNINAYPTLLFLDQEGNILTRNEGSLSASALKALGEKAISNR